MAGKDGSYTISGEAEFILDGEDASAFLLAARESSGLEHLVLLDVPAEGIEVTPFKAWDITRHPVRLQIHGAQATEEQVLAQALFRDALELKLDAAKDLWGAPT